MRKRAIVETKAVPLDGRIAPNQTPIAPGVTAFPAKPSVVKPVPSTNEVIGRTELGHGGTVPVVRFP